MCETRVQLNDTTILNKTYQQVQRTVLFNFPFASKIISSRKLKEYKRMQIEINKLN